MGITWSRKSAEMRWQRILKRPTLEAAKKFTDKDLQVTESEITVWDDLKAQFNETAQYMKEKNLTISDMLMETQLADVMMSDQSDCSGG